MTHLLVHFWHRSSWNTARRSAVLGLLVGLMAASPAIAQSGAAPENECDRLAQPPKMAMGKLPTFAEGVAASAIRATAAREACAKAMADAPGEMRFVAYAGRAADAAHDTREAARLYRLAADGGNALAQNNLGAMLAAGAGSMPRNLKGAEQLYRLAADQGLPGGEANLGAMYAVGQGVRRDDKEAVRLFQAAAEYEDAQAQTGLGVMYIEGRGGLQRDPREAARMWRLAADQGSVEARNNLRRMGARN